MFQRCSVFALLLIAPTKALAQIEQLDRPYAALFEIQDYPASQLRALRSDIERQRKEETEACRKDEQRLKHDLNTARASLKQLNGSSGVDTPAMDATRSDLHTQISSLEHHLRDKEGECEHRIPLSFEITLSKMHLLEHWPQRREQTIHTLEEGRARERKHGDIDDIGYRKVADNQAKDISLGEQAIRQMAGSRLMPAEIQDAAVRQYVQSLSEKLARESDLKVPLHVNVLESADINATGLPGGFLFLTSGLVLACDTEGQLAGVISQQIAHIAARHATQASKRSLLPKIFVPVAQVATGLFTGGVSNAGAYYGMNYGFQGLGVLMDRTLVSSNAKAQMEADQLGIQYAWKAGFDPKGFISFLDTIAQKNEYSRTESYFLTKPALGERLIDAFTEIQYLPRKDINTVDSADFWKAKDRVRQLARF